MASLTTIERLARHLHELYRASATGIARGAGDWADLDEYQRETYRTVASGLLLRPPGWLKKVLR